MRVEMVPRLHPRRGGEVKVGNVYGNPHGKNYYKIVVSILKREGERPWNNIIMLHVNTSGDIVGSSTGPALYVSEHQDLVGIVRNMPSMKVEWLGKEEK